MVHPPVRGTRRTEPVQQKKWTITNMWTIKKNLPINWGILICTVILACLGLLMVLSASSYSSSVSGDSMDEFSQQVFGVAVGLVGMVVVLNIDYRFFNQRWVVLLVLGITYVLMGSILVMELIPALNPKTGYYAPYVNEAYRWIRIGSSKGFYISIQPSEIAKIAIVLYLSYYMNLRHKQMGNLLQGVVPPLFVIVGILFCLYEQPNLSTLGVLCIVTLFMMVAGGIKKWVITSMMVGGFGALGALAILIPDRLIRFMSFVNPWTKEMRDGAGFQLIQSYYALGNGGWFGTGLGGSKQKHLFLPYAYSDFIYAIVGEEFGFIGGVIILLVFLLLIYLGYRVAINARDRFGCYLALGTTSMVAIQVIINILVVTGFAPTTGLPLPFFTAGGTTMMIFLTTMGLLLSVSRQQIPLRQGVCPAGLVWLKRLFMSKQKPVPKARSKTNLRGISR